MEVRMATMPAVSTPLARRKSRPPRKPAKLSRLHKPDNLSLEDWQTGLRRQFGREQKFAVRNIGDQTVFSEFLVTNPQSKSSYRVAIRGTQPGESFCACPDFATNALGTCKHIEFTLGWLEKKRGGKAALAAGFQPAYSEVYLQYGARREVRFRPGSECPRELARLAARYFDSDGALRPDALDRFQSFLSEAGNFEHDLRCYDDALGYIAAARDADRRCEVLAKAFPRGIKSAAFAKLLKVPLYDYQREGALFAARAGRCLIGDEMGLGKTIQALAATEMMARHFDVGRVLIICPTSLKHQWQREIERFTDRNATVVGGMRPAREKLYRSENFFKITNYDTIHRDLDLIAQWSPDLVILDEAQRIKNWNTRAARSVKKIASPYAIVLTGTPLENRLEELVSIVQFVDQHRLGPTYRLLHEHQVRDEHGKVIGYRDLDKIGQSLAPILVRRQKDQVLDQLPERLDKHFFVPMTPEQMGHHEENRDIVAQIVRRWRRFKFLSEADQRRLMIALQNMRMSCDSTYLLDHVTDFGVKADELATLAEEVFERPDTKVVVFSQWLRMHELLTRRFQRRKWDFVLFHGGVPGPQRKGLVDRFREDQECRAFLATDAGGVGLNLQHANVVINMDIPWNPAVLEQRIGRVHRLGQKQPVRVVNFVAQGTIEHGMLSLLQFKKSLFAGVLDGGEKEVFLGGSRLTRFMETVEKATTDIPAAMAETPAEAEEPAERRPSQAPGTPGSAATQTTQTAQQPVELWSGLLQTGLALLEQVAAASRESESSDGRRDTSASRATVPGLSIVRRDPQTGSPYLKLPLPDPEILDGFLKSIGGLLERLRG
jgi:superfamily II DNA or RNA helicase